MALRWVEICRQKLQARRERRLEERKAFLLERRQDRKAIREYWEEEERKERAEREARRPARPQPAEPPPDPNRLLVLSLISELIEIAETRPFLKAGGKPDWRTRLIGVQLNSIGGVGEMRAAHREVSRYLVRRGAARELEVAWDGIGEWWS
ncbi:hypothetical protein [Kribbella sp. NPDC055071]